MSFLLLAVGPLIALALQNPETFVLCRLNQSVRTIMVQVDKEGSCSTTYTKNGVDQNVGSGRNLSSCMSFLNNIKDNLEKSNWQCRQVAATVTSDKE